MRILIAAGIFPPEAGGPATFAKKIFDGFKDGGHKVQVLTFCRGKRPDEWGDDIYCVDASKSTVGRYFSFFMRLWRLSKNADIIYAFDLISVGLACAKLKMFKPSKKLVFRIGGDFQWEAALQKGYFDGTIWQYWEQKKLSQYEKIIKWLTDFTLKKADLIIFNANLIRDVFLKYRFVPEAKVCVIKNIVPNAERVSISERRDGKIRMLFVGRLIAMKNLIRLLKAFEELIKDASLENKLRLEIDGDGPEARKIIDFVKNHNLAKFVSIGQKMSRREVLEAISRSDIIANISLTEVNAHFVAEAMLMKKPLILTRESEQFYTGQKNDLFYYADPLNVKDIAIKILQAVRDIESNKIYFGGQIEDSAWSLEKVVRQHEIAFSNLK